MKHSLTIIIPAYNEAARLPRTLDVLCEFLSEHHPTAAVVVVDDGSSDATAAVARRAAERDDRVSVVRLSANQGKGAAIARGVFEARGDVVLFFDADLSYPLEMIGVAVEAIEEGADLAVGDREQRDVRSNQGYGLQRQLATLVFNAAVEWLLGLGISDTQCGFKAFRRDVARALFSSLHVRRFGFDVELLFLARRWDLDIVRLPIAMRHRPGSSVRVGSDGLQMLLDIVSIRLHDLRGDYPATMPGGMVGNGQRSPS